MFKLKLKKLLRVDFLLENDEKCKNNHQKEMVSGVLRFIGRDTKGGAAGGNGSAGGSQ